MSHVHQFLDGTANRSRSAPRLAVFARCEPHTKQNRAGEVDGPRRTLLRPLPSREAPVHYAAAN